MKITLETLQEKHITLELYQNQALICNKCAFGREIFSRACNLALMQSSMVDMHFSSIQIDIGRLGWRHARQALIQRMERGCMKAQSSL